MRTGARPSLRQAVAYAVATSILWAAAIVLVKLGLEDIPRLTFASLRYLVGAVALVVWRSVKTGTLIPRVERSLLPWLIGLGVLLYGVVPAAQFISLDIVEAVTFNLVFQAGIPLITALLAGVVLKEATSRWEWFGVAVVIGGVFLFYPTVPTGDQAVGIMLAVVAAAGVGGSNALQRKVMRGGSIGALDAAVVPMLMGSVGLFLVARLVEPFPELGREQILLILALGVINTALAFTLWHMAMRTLNALHAGVIASAQVVEVPVLAFIFLGESLTTGRIVGSVLVLAGILLVHLSKAAGLRFAAPSPPEQTADRIG
jgi:drug/metabolite transporter (DMT)-like permease